MFLISDLLRVVNHSNLELLAVSIQPPPVFLIKKSSYHSISSFSSVFLDVTETIFWLKLARLLILAIFLSWGGSVGAQCIYIKSL